MNDALVFPTGIVETTDPSLAIVRFTSGGDPVGLPRCPNCGKTMQRHLSIEAHKLREVLPFVDHDVDLIYCWQGSVANGNAYTGTLKTGFEFLEWVKNP